MLVDPGPGRITAETHASPAPRIQLPDHAFGHSGQNMTYISSRPGRLRDPRGFFASRLYPHVRPPVRRYLCLPIC